MIDILMATYNGERYLAQQIESILGQSFTEWRLIIRDDCSCDNTLSILKKYQLKYPSKITIIPSQHPSGSAMNNFFKLLEHTNSEYVMFSDQDDVWNNDKIEITLTKMKEMEQQYGKNTPLLVHTDLCVVDDNLNVINPSLFAMQDMDYKRDKLNNLLATNIVTGCTMMMNIALIKLLSEKPRVAVMHDMWIALVAAAFGKIGFVNETTVLYRQHGKNANGAKNVNSFYYMKNKLIHLNCVRDFLILQYKQAKEFLRIYHKLLSQEQFSLLLTYSEFANKNWFEKTYALFKYKLNKKGIIRVLGQILL